MNDRKKVLGQKCKCRVIALNNVMFYEPEIYIGEQGLVPILARVIENGQQIEIRGKVKIANKGSSKSPFTVETNAGVTACEGSFDISDISEISKLPSHAVTPALVSTVKGLLLEPLFAIFTLPLISICCPFSITRASIGTRPCSPI